MLLTVMVATGTSSSAQASPTTPQTPATPHAAADISRLVPMMFMSDIEVNPDFAEKPAAPKPLPAKRGVIRHQCQAAAVSLTTPKTTMRPYMENAFSSNIKEHAAREGAQRA